MACDVVAREARMPTSAQGLYMLRPASWSRPAGESPVRVSTGAPATAFAESDFDKKADGETGDAEHR